MLMAENLRNIFDKNILFPQAENQIYLNAQKGETAVVTAVLLAESDLLLERKAFGSHRAC
jgi:hypothetical protein